MTFEQILEAIKSLGVPVGILAYVLWRGDNFLNHLIKKLDKFNDELNTINFSLRDLITLMKK